MFLFLNSLKIILPFIKYSGTELSCWEGNVYLLIPTPFCVLSLTKNSHELKEEEKERKKRWLVSRSDLKS